MASDMYLKIEGIDGESKDDGHAHEIDVMAWSWGMSQSGTMHGGGGGGAGKVAIQDISFTKSVDKSSSNLMLACCKGTHIEEAVLTVRKAGGDPLEYLIITMKGVLVSSVSSGGSEQGEGVSAGTGTDLFFRHGKINLSPAFVGDEMSEATLQSLRDGNLEQTLQLLQDQVRNDPSAGKHRVFLSQLLCVMGQWDRALTQLSVVAELDAATIPMVQTYREAIQCEKLRHEVFAGNKTPLIFGEPESWVALMLEALRISAQGKHEQAQQLREQAFEEAPATSGKIDGKPFEWIADADPRLGPMLEVIVNGRYYWVPMHRIAEVILEEPVDLRDVVWSPGFFRWANGGETVGLVPARYAGSESSDNDRIRLARLTEWVEPSAGVYLGQGQRLLTTDGGDHPLMDVRSIALDVVEADAAVASDPPAAD